MIGLGFFIWLENLEMDWWCIFKEFEKGKVGGCFGEVGVRRVGDFMNLGKGESDGDEWLLEVLLCDGGICNCKCGEGMGDCLGDCFFCIVWLMVVVKEFNGGVSMLLMVWFVEFIWVFGLLWVNLGCGRVLFGRFRGLLLCDSVFFFEFVGRWVGRVLFLGWLWGSLVVELVCWWLEFVWVGRGFICIFFVFCSEDNIDWNFNILMRLGWIGVIVVVLFWVYWGWFVCMLLVIFVVMCNFWFFWFFGDGVVGILILLILICGVCFKILILVIFGVLFDWLFIGVELFFGLLWYGLNFFVFLFEGLK